jgi:hypothetical protein
VDDTLKIVTVGFFAFLTFHASLERRAARAADSQMHESFHSTGTVRSVVESRGMFGLLANDIWSIDIYSEHQQSDRLPFYIYPKSGWKGSIRHLRLHFSEFSLAGLPIERMEADIPFATYDIGNALYKNRLVLRGAGEGPALVQVSELGLQVFIQRKYPRLMRDVHVEIATGHVTISGKLALFNGFSPFSVTGTLCPRDGRYLDLTDPVVALDGKPLDARAALALLKTINPVLDNDTDLKLGGFFHLSSVDVGQGILSIRGAATVPRAPLDATTPH